MRLPRWIGFAAVALVVAAGLPGVAEAQRSAAPAAEAIAIAIASRAEAIRNHPERPALDPAAFPVEGTEWQVRWAYEGEVIIEVDVDLLTGRVVAVWEDEQANAPLARGYRGWFGGDAGAVWVWLPLSVLFLLPFFDVRRPLRTLHLDLAALLSLGISVALFSHAHIEWSVATALPPLLYLLVRCLRIARRPEVGDEPVFPHVRAALIVPALILVLALRIGLNLDDAGERYYPGWGTVTSTVTDVGFVGVVGADRITNGKELYVDNERHGDTYGALNYLLYVPFEAVWPFDGESADLPAAHAVAIAADSLVVGLLFLLGLRSRPGVAGRRLGLALAWAWATCPFTLYVLASNTNDAFIAVAAAAFLVVFGRPLLAAVVLGLGAAAKFVPALLLPLAARAPGVSPPRSAIVAGLAFAVAFAAPFAPVIPDGGVAEIYAATLGYQTAEPGAFSIWFYLPGPAALQSVSTFALAAAAAAVFVKVRPGDRLQGAALAAALLIGLELTLGYWFYFYVVWFLPPLLYALFGRLRT